MADVEKIILDYFRDLFDTSAPSHELIDEILENLIPVVTPAMNQHISRPFTALEVTQALSQMSSLKYPGLGWLPAVFFQKYWHIIGSNISSCVLRFLNHNLLPAKLNYTFIVLILKVPNPKRIMEFRPISLCNVVYKTGSKMLANRVKRYLNYVISPTQSAFNPRRLITDNVLVAYEVNHFLKCRTKGSKQYMALKLDVSKAYDRIEWTFLRCVLLRLGFADTLVNSIMLCVSSASYSFLLNGKQFGDLQPSRGLRQGDPLSSYLFICCVEAFIKLVQTAVADGRLHGVRVAPTAPEISNLCFADDTVLFCRAEVAEAEEVV